MSWVMTLFSGLTGSQQQWLGSQADRITSNTSVIVWTDYLEPGVLRWSCQLVILTTAAMILSALRKTSSMLTSVNIIRDICTFIFSFFPIWLQVCFSSNNKKSGFKIYWLLGVVVNENHQKSSTWFLANRNSLIYTTELAWNNLIIRSARKAWFMDYITEHLD